MIVEQYIDMAGKIHIVWQMAAGTRLFLKFTSQPSEDELLAIEAQYTEEHSDDDLVPAAFDLLENRYLLIEFVRYIKANPEVTPNQISDWYVTKLWYEQVILRTIVYYIGTILAERKEIDLTDMTEAQVFRKVRNWIVAKPLRRISRLLFGERRVLD
jgi:hypothetical protein